MAKFCGPNLDEIEAGEFRHGEVSFETGAHRRGPVQGDVRFHKDNTDDPRFLV